MSLEREVLTHMFETDLAMAKAFNQVGDLACARLHLANAAEKLTQIAALAAPVGSDVRKLPTIDV